MALLTVKASFPIAVDMGTISLGIVILLLLKLVCTILYRLFFSPLASFPGPKLAAATSLFEFYFDYFKEGTYCYEIEKMHREYGPIVRINPRELSISDSTFYDKIYVGGSVRPTEIDPQFVSGIGFEGTFFLTVSHKLHRQLRKPFEPYFSRGGVAKLQPIIDARVKQLIRRFEGLAGTGKVIRLDHAMLAYTGDVIGHICVDKPRELLEDKEFAPEWFSLHHSMVRCIPLLQQFPWAIRILRRTPRCIVRWINPKFDSFGEWNEAARAHIEEVISGKLPDDSDQTVQVGGKPTIFRQLARNSSLTGPQWSADRLTKEAQILMGAGSVSPARTLHFIAFYLLSNYHMRKRLEEELSSVMCEWPDKIPALSQLERLPYLQALIKEGLRHSYGTMHRLPRISATDIQYRDWTIPAGVPVGMTAYFQHTDPNVFSNPFEFQPERWLADVTPEMTRNLVPFSRGSRNCIGMHLAYAEVTLMLAALFRPGAPAFELFETDEIDVIAAHDFIVPMPRLDSKGVRVVFR